MLWRDTMSHSFGEGYATRSDEEGFGGVYGGNQSKPEMDPGWFACQTHTHTYIYTCFFVFNLFFLLAMSKY